MSTTVLRYGKSWIIAKVRDDSKSPQHFYEYWAGEKWDDWQGEARTFDSKDKAADYLEDNASRF